MSAWHWPQWAIIGLATVGVLIHAANEGQSKSIKFDLKAKLIAVALEMWLLWMGGFFP